MTLADLKQLGITKKFKKPELAQLLEAKYPGYDWEKVFLLKGRYAQQKRLERAVRTLFQVGFFPDAFLVHAASKDCFYSNTQKGHGVSVNVRKEAGILHPDTREYMELDLYIPSLRLAFEFQVDFTPTKIVNGVTATSI